MAVPPPTDAGIKTTTYTKVRDSVHDEENPAATETVVTPSALPPLVPPALLKACRAKTKLHMAGFVFSKDQIARLCIDAWGFSQEKIDHFGPLDCSFMHLGRFVNLNSPEFVPIGFIDPKTNRPRKAWMLPCRIVFVGEGAMVPDVSFDEDAQIGRAHV